MSDIQFKKVGIEWWVYADGTKVGSTRANGSRIRERSWTYRASDGTQGRAGSRRSAAEILSRRAHENRGA